MVAVNVESVFFFFSYKCELTIGFLADSYGSVKIVIKILQRKKFATKDQNWEECCFEKENNILVCGLHVVNLIEH